LATSSATAEPSELALGQITLPPGRQRQPLEVVGRIRAQVPMLRRVSKDRAEHVDVVVHRIVAPALRLVLLAPFLQRRQVELVRGPGPEEPRKLADAIGLDLEAARLDAPLAIRHKVFERQLVKGDRALGADVLDFRLDAASIDLVDQLAQVDALLLELHDRPQVGLDGIDTRPRKVEPLAVDHLEQLPPSADVADLQDELALHLCALLQVS
jgi:hypothetical protein